MTTVTRKWTVFWLWQSRSICPISWGWGGWGGLTGSHSLMGVFSFLGSGLSEMRRL